MTWSWELSYSNIAPAPAPAPPEFKCELQFRENGLLRGYELRLQHPDIKYYTLCAPTTSAVAMGGLGGLPS